MGLTQSALMETRLAFDGVADTYGAANDANPVIQMMRARTIDAVRRHAPPGGRILDLGCGPGPDAVTLAGLGFDVTAIDWSSAMVGKASAAVRAHGLQDRVCVRALGIQELDTLPEGRWHLAYSNLGPLNCVPDLEDTARAVARRLEPGGTCVVSVIGRACPWEWLIYGLRGDWSRLRVRFTSGFVPVPLEGRTVWTQYVSPAQCAEAFMAAGFEVVGLRALGLAVPPPYLDAFCRRHPRLLDLLVAIDDFTGAWPVARHLGDHFLMELRLT